MRAPSRMAQAPASTAQPTPQRSRARCRKARCRMQLVRKHTWIIIVTVSVFQLAMFWLNADASANICAQSHTPPSTPVPSRSECAAGHAHFALGCSAAAWLHAPQPSQRSCKEPQQQVAHPKGSNPRPGRRSSPSNQQEQRAARSKRRHARPRGPDGWQAPMSNAQPTPQRSHARCQKARC